MAPLDEAPAGKEASEAKTALVKPKGTDDAGVQSARKAQPMTKKPELAAPVEEKQRGPRIVGRLVDKLGNPVAMGEVGLARRLIFGPDEESAPDDSDFSTATDVDGHFELEIEGASSRVLIAQAVGYAPLEPRSVVLPETGVLDVGDLVLSEGAILSGHVYDSFGNPVPGARLMNALHDGPGSLLGDPLLMQVRRPLAVTESDGSFRVESLACGAWRISVRSDEHPTLEVDGVADIPGQEISGLSFQLEESATIAGRVVGLPDSGADNLVVRARPIMQGGAIAFGFAGAGLRQAKCSADGEFILRGLVAGQNYELQAREMRPTRGNFLFTGANIRSDSVRTLAGTSGIELIFSRGGSLSFQVVDDSTGAPVTAMVVSSGTQFVSPVLGEDGRAKREYPEGMVEVPGLYPRGTKKQVNLEVESTGYRNYRVEDVEFLPGEDLNLGVVRLTPAPVLVVRVTDAKSGVPVTGARVRLSPAPAPPVMGERNVNMSFSVGGEDDDPIRIAGGGNSAITDEFGVATLNSIEDTTCLLRVESDGHAPFEDSNLFLPSGKRMERDVALREGGSVLVTVLDANGQPMSGVKVSHRTPGSSTEMFVFGGGSAMKDRTNSEGKVRFNHLEPGEHSFRIADSDGPAAGFMGEDDAVMVMSQSGGVDTEAWTKIGVDEGVERKLELRASPRGKLDGRVREAGVVLAGATLTLSPRRDPNDQMAGLMPGGMFGGGAKARTDGDGYYSFDDVKPGEYTLKVSHPSRAMPTDLDLEVRERGGSVDQRFDVELSVAVIEGRIEDESGKPVADVEVWATTASAGGATAIRFMVIDDSDSGSSMSFGDDVGGGRVRTDAEGYYRLRGVPTEVKLEVHADGNAYQESTSEPVTVASDQTRSGLDLVLRAGGEIDITVVKADGSSPGLCMIIATYQGDADLEPRREMGRQSGATRISGLRPGEWEFAVQVFSDSGMQQPGGEQTAMIVAGKLGELTLTAP